LKVSAFKTGRECEPVGKQFLEVSSRLASKDRSRNIHGLFPIRLAGNANLGLLVKKTTKENCPCHAFDLIVRGERINYRIERLSDNHHLVAAAPVLKILEDTDNST
jgi:hypothetical protein